MGKEGITMPWYRLNPKQPPNGCKVEIIEDGGRRKKIHFRHGMAPVEDNTGKFDCWCTPGGPLVSGELDDQGRFRASMPHKAPLRARAESQSRQAPRNDKVQITSRPTTPSSPKPKKAFDFPPDLTGDDEILESLNQHAEQALREQASLAAAMKEAEEEETPIQMEVSDDGPDVGGGEPDVPQQEPEPEHHVPPKALASVFAKLKKKEAEKEIEESKDETPGVDPLAGSDEWSKDKWLKYAEDNGIEVAAGEKRLNKDALIMVIKSRIAK